MYFAARGLIIFSAVRHKNRLVSTFIMKKFNRCVPIATLCVIIANRSAQCRRNVDIRCGTATIVYVLRKTSPSG